MKPANQLTIDLDDLIDSLNLKSELTVCSSTAKKLAKSVPRLAGPFYASCEQNKLTIAEALKLVEQKIWYHKQAVVVLNALRNDMSSHLSKDLNVPFDHNKHTHHFANI